jgi:hypothetical protein
MRSFVDETQKRIRYSHYRDGCHHLLKRCQCLFIDESIIDESSEVMCWARDHGTTHWILNRTLISRSFVLTSFRKSYHFQLTTIVLRACSLLVDRDSYHSRRRGEPTVINVKRILFNRIRLLWSKFRHRRVSIDWWTFDVFVMIKSLSIRSLSFLR